MNDNDTLLTLYVEDENKIQFRKICGEAGYSLEAGLNVMLQQLLKQPDIVRKMLLHTQWVKTDGVKEISVEELAAGIQNGTLEEDYGDPVLIKQDSAEPYILISARRYGKMVTRLERLEEKLVIHKNSPC